MSETVDVSSGQNGSAHFDGFDWSSVKPGELVVAVDHPEQIPELQGVRKRDEVCIVGYAPGRELAPFRDKEKIDIWGMNDLWGQWTHVPALAPHLRWDAWFDPHKREVMDKANRMKDEQIKWLQAQPADFPIFTLQRFEDIPGSRRLPYAEVCKQLGVKVPYFTSTPAYMMAVALALGYKKIHIYGINLLGTGEYEYQRPCMEFWIGVAMGRGVEVVTPEESTLCKATFLYGYDTHGFPEALRVLELVKAKKVEAEHNKISAIAQQAKLEGQTEVINWMNDMLRHAAYGGYIPEVKNITPEAAQDQQKRDASKRSMLLLADLVERIKAGDMSAADRIAPAAAVAFGLPDSEVWR